MATSGNIRLYNQPFIPCSVFLTWVFLLRTVELEVPTMIAWPHCCPTYLCPLIMNHSVEHKTGLLSLLFKPFPPSLPPSSPSGTSHVSVLQLPGEGCCADKVLSCLLLRVCQDALRHTPEEVPQVQRCIRRKRLSSHLHRLKRQFHLGYMCGKRGSRR